MYRVLISKGFLVLGLATALLVLCGFPAHAAIDGVTGTAFNLAAKQDHISSSDGDSILMWGYANGAGRMQFPGPTLIVNEGDTITVTLTNELPPAAGNVSIVFPGHQVAAAGGVAGLLTREAPPGGATAVTYTFTATHPGTYLYHSGTRPDLQVEMGLIGAIIVRPSGFNPAAPQAYRHADSAYTREFLFLLTEMDVSVHRNVEFGKMNQINTATFFPVNWFINGRNFPDNMAKANAAWLPTQPYNCSPMMHPGEKVLCRVIGAGRDLHPFHFHGNNVRVIARDGWVLQSAPGAGIDLAYSDFTVTSVPGQTFDAIFEWTGAKLGWDVYGHKQDLDNPPTGNFPGAEDIDHNGNGIFDSVPLAKNEDPADHGKPLPVILPTRDDVIFGQFYSGSPYLGQKDGLPPDHPGLNVGGGFFYMWHSHSEKELTSNDLFPGGMMTFMNIVPWKVAIVE